MPKLRKLTSIVVLVLLMAAGLATGDQDECEATLKITHIEFTALTLSVTIENPEPTPQTGYVIAEVVYEGEQQLWGWPIALPAGGALAASLSVQSPMAVLDVWICDEIPDDIVESPDPVDVVFGRPILPDPGGGKGGNKE